MGLTARIKNYLRYKKYKRNNIYIKDCHLVSETLKINSPAQIHPGTIIGENVTIGRYTYIGDNNRIAHNVTIGNFCSFGTNIQVSVGIHPLTWLSSSPFQYRSDDKVYNCIEPKLQFTESPPTLIGHDVWVGTMAVIMGGLTIGTGAVIGAGAIVTKNVPPYAIVGGVPAKIIRYRFNEETIKRLLESKWWEKDVKELIDLPLNNINECLDSLFL
ncbi:MAG: CatB-related O-acetyltransferase [Negativicutes bacterium]|nr:CatB-related O-acetyltransferase [Negativicutes bacterium]